MVEIADLFESPELFLLQLDLLASSASETKQDDKSNFICPLF